QPRRDVAARGGIEGGEGPVARCERALDVAELAKKIRDELLGLDLERRVLRGVCDLRGLARHDGAAREVPFVEVVAGAPQEPEAYGPRRRSAAHEPPERLEVK